ncbi:MAG: hypothetical protein H0W88_09390 [Parachlamydiaceae bacterium]|nr:hypothetical protein [Parachlamydiaceae bacterium]
MIQNIDQTRTFLHTHPTKNNSESFIQKGSSLLQWSWKIIKNTYCWLISRLNSLFFRTTSQIPPQSITQIQNVTKIPEKPLPIVQVTKPDEPPKSDQPLSINTNIPSESSLTEQVKVLEKQIKWVSGSRSPAIALMTNKVALEKFDNKPALVSGKTLYNHNLVPLTGELYFLLNIISGVALSDLFWAFHHSNEPTFVFKPDNELDRIYQTHYKTTGNLDLLKLKTAVLRLILTKEKISEYPKIKEHIRTEILNKLDESNLTYFPTWKKHMHLVNKPVSTTDLDKLKELDSTLKIGQLVAVMHESQEYKFAFVSNICENSNLCSVIAFEDGNSQSVDKKFVKVFTKIPNIKEAEFPKLQIDQIKNFEESMRTQKEKVQAILDLFDNAKPLEFTDDEKDLIHQSFPIIWASTTLESTPTEGMMGRPGERYLTKPALLGKDIQLLFVPKDNIQKAQKALSAYHVKVLDVDILHIIDKNLNKVA